MIGTGKRTATTSAAVAPIPSKAQRIYDNTCRMLRDRGYLLAHQSSEFVPFEDTGSMRPKKRKRTFAEASDAPTFDVPSIVNALVGAPLWILALDGASAPVAVFRDESTSDIGVDVLRTLTKWLTPCRIAHVILLVNRSLTAHAQKEINGQGTDALVSGVLWEIHRAGEKLFQPLRSYTNARKHTLLNEEQIRELEAKHRSRNHWAKLKPADPVYRHLGCRPGNVVLYEFRNGKYGMRMAV